VGRGTPRKGQKVGWYGMFQDSNHAAARTLHDALVDIAGSSPHLPSLGMDQCVEACPDPAGELWTPKLVRSRSRSQFPSVFVVIMRTLTIQPILDARTRTEMWYGKSIQCKCVKQQCEGIHRTCGCT